jgi:hypothetical protein
MRLRMALSGDNANEFSLAESQTSLAIQAKRTDEFGFDCLTEGEANVASSPGKSKLSALKHSDQVATMARFLPLASPTSSASLGRLG